MLIERPLFTHCHFTFLLGAKRSIATKEKRASQRKRHNSWHDLVKSDSAPALNQPKHASPNSVQYCMNLLEKQEYYIKQLEEENQFCREQMSTVLSQLKTSKGFAGDDEFIIPLREHDSVHQQHLANLETENEALRHQLQIQAMSSQSQEHNRNIIEKLRADNEMLNQALNQLSGESEDVKRREAEAAEEVRRIMQMF